LGALKGTKISLDLSVMQGNMPDMAYMPIGKTDQGGLRDKLLLVASAIVVCVIGVGAFWIAGESHTGPLWVFFGLNAIGFITVVGRKFPNHWKAPSFISFFLAWLLVHGIVATILAAAVPFLYWLPIFGVELFVGFLAARLLFGTPGEGT
jgi:hypothetical protein